jgi:HPt (histidine-containing phosphotransfer) domain-containing protein
MTTINIQTKDSNLECLFKEIINNTNLVKYPSLSHLQLKIIDGILNENLIIQDSDGNTLDYVKTPVNKESLTKRINFWITPLHEQDFINRETLLKLDETLGSEHLRKIFDSFVVSSVKQFELTKEALIQNDFKQLFDATHYLKTSAGIVGAQPLFLFCEIAIEKTRTKENWTPYFLKKFAELESIFNMTVTNFRP